MAFAPPDPKRVKGDRDRIARQRQEAIQAERDAIERKRQIRMCYRDHTPFQIRHAGGLIQADSDGAETIRLAESVDGIEVWETIGKSCNGALRVLRKMS